MNSDAAEAALGLLGLSPHNVPPPQIIPLKRKQSTQSLLPVPNNQPEFNPDAINCICGFGYDDGFSIACDVCSRWCHAACFDVVEGEVPEEWACWICEPRPVDRDRAVKLQKARQKKAQDIEQPRVPRVSPGADRKPRRASAAAIDGSKRKRRSSINAPLHHHQHLHPQHHQHHHHHQQQQQQQSHLNSQPPPAEDEHVDIDEPWMYSYVPITTDIIPQQDTRIKLQRQAQHWRGVTALAPIRVYQDPPPTIILPLPNSSFSHPTLSLNTNPSVRPPSYAMHTTTPIPSSHLITPYKSTIIPTSTYLADPLNAYAHLGMPKPFVHLLGHPLDVTLDSRITGNKGRFVRSGCRPNAVLRPVICPKAKQADSDPETISFGVFALRDLKADEEVVLGWEWDDGNAVHSLPAMIENPYAFPLLDTGPDANSPTQLEHLRYQMMGILHTLSSTFTTCACGAKAKDCALSQMAAFVDGELPRDAGNRTADLGPLVGATRGFRTREKVPMSGGMSGVEMDLDCEEPVAGPSTMAHERRHTVADVAYAFRSSTEQRHHSKQGSPKIRRTSLPTLTLSPATASPSLRIIKNSKGKERAVSHGDVQEQGDEEDEGSSSGEGRVFMRSGQKGTSLTRQHVRIDPSLSSCAHTPDEIIQNLEEDKMPPKMRKRWIQRSAVILKDTLRQGPASPESVVSLGSSVNGSGVGADEADDWMDIDETQSGPGGLNEDSLAHSVGINHTPQSSTPTPLESRAVLSIANPANENLAASPSASFAKLSLLSPILPSLSPSPSNTLSHSVPRYNTSSPSPLSQNGQSVNDCPLTIQQDHSGTDLSITSSSLRLQSSGAKLPLTTVVHNSKAVDRASSKSPLPISILEQCHSEVNCTSQGSSTQLLDNFKLPYTNGDSSQAPITTPSSPSNQAPGEPPSQPLTPKVKMSLKDFVLRKKKQREEEMAKATSPSKSTTTVVEPVTSVDTKVDSYDVEMNGHGDVDGSLNANFPAAKPGEDVNFSTDSYGQPHKENAEDLLILDGSMKDSPDVVHVDEAPTSIGLAHTHSALTLPTINDSLHQTLNGADSQTTEIELAGTPIPDAVFIPRDLNPKKSASPNGPAANRGCDQTIGDVVCMPILSSHIRRISQEDGEIQGFTPPKHSPFAMRAHTPPTQPRSFHNIPTSPNSASATSPSAQLHRPSQPLPLQPNRLPATTGLVSRPLPSGPRALRAASHLSGSTMIHPPSRPLSGSHSIPRGPSADRERMEWDRERSWLSRSRGRGNGWGR